PPSRCRNRPASSRCLYAGGRNTDRPAPFASPSSRRARGRPSALLEFFEPISEAQSLQDFRRGLFERQGLVAGVAVLRDRLSVRRGVLAVVTPEAAGRVGVPEVVRIAAPADLEVRENVAVVDREDGLPGLLDLGRTR